MTLTPAGSRRLAQRLAHGADCEQVLLASAANGIDPGALASAYEYWEHDFRLEAQALFEQPCFQWRDGAMSLRFIHQVSRAPEAVPLLLLHGHAGSLAALGGLAPQLARSEAGSVAFHVVCPLLDDAPAGREAAATSALMRELGYDRYLVHGSDSGAAVAMGVAAADEAGVLGAQVTSVAAYPSELEAELCELSSAEKSQLALLWDLYDRTRSELPRTPLEHLARAMSYLDIDGNSQLVWRDPLLTGLSATCLSHFDNRREEHRRARALSPAASTRVPLSVQSFPLGAPSLRRFVEAAHVVLEWREHDNGGPCPELEQPQLLVDSLRAFAARLV